MAISAPDSITVGDVIRGSDVNITWSAVPDAVGYRVQRSVNGIPFDDWIINNTTLTYMTDVAGEDWNTVQYRVQAFKYEGDYVGAYFEYSDWTTSEVKTAQAVTPPAPITGARLEQFQNSAGTDIYPRTIVEGIFRKSDGKSLLEILENIKSEIGNALYATFQIDVATGSLLMVADDSYAGPQFRLVNGELEVVYG